MSELDADQQVELDPAINTSGELSPEYLEQRNLVSFVCLQEHSPLLISLLAQPVFDARRDEGARVLIKYIDGISVVQRFEIDANSLDLYQSIDRKGEHSYLAESCCDGMSIFIMPFNKFYVYAFSRECLDLLPVGLLETARRQFFDDLSIMADREAIIPEYWESVWNRYTKRQSGPIKK